MMTHSKAQTSILAIVIAAAFSAAAVAQCGGGYTAKKAKSGQKDIVDTAVAAGSFSTLVAAVQAAGLVDALKSDGPFTVFAPTDDAFAKLPAGTVESLLEPENRDQLRAILLYHVVPAKVMAKDAMRASGATTMNGQRLDIKTKSGKVMIDNATVTKADIRTSNGVIHVIDTVVLPTSQNIVETAQSTKKFNTLLTAATKAGLASALAGDGPYTVFAPTDEAFAKLPAGTIESLLKPENKDQLASILKYHVVPGRVYSDDALKAGKAETLLGKEIRLASAGGTARVNGVRLIATDVDASNGVIHIIDEVILPQ